MKNTTLYIPTWPEASDNAGRLGVEYRSSYDNSMDSFYLPFRARPKTSDVYKYSDSFRVWNDIALYVWMSAEYGIHIECKAHAVHSGNLRYMELLCKRMKWAMARLDKADGLDKLTPESLPYALISICEALGIKETVQYNGMQTGNTYAPVTAAIQLIVAEVTTRYNRLEKRQAA